MIDSSTTTIDRADPHEAVVDSCYQDLLLLANDSSALCNGSGGLDVLNDTVDLEIDPVNGTRLDVDGLNNWWAMLALVLVLGTAAGNILVCLAIARERRLQNVTNYFLMSLAITDLLVAVLVMPLGILTLVRGGRLGAGGRCLSNTGSPVQVDRQHNLLLHTVGRDAAYVRVDSEIAGETATEYRRNYWLVLRMAGWPAGPIFGRAGQERHVEAISVEQKPGRKRRYTAAHFRHVDRHRADDTGHSRTLASGKRAATLGHVRPSRFRRRDAQVVEGPGGYHQPWKPYGHTEVHASTLDPATSASATVAQVQLPSRERGERREQRFRFQDEPLDPRRSQLANAVEASTSTRVHVQRGSP